MPAIRKLAPADGAEATRLVELPTPRPARGEVVIKVLATALCGTDRHIYHWDPSIRHSVSPPRTYGHEFCGEVAEAGPGVELELGSYVSAEMHVVCGRCRPCRLGQRHVCENTRILGLHDEGAFAGYVKVPASNVVRLDRSIVPPRVGAFLDALGNAVHTTQYAELEGARVAVFGYGPIGAMAAAVAHHAGAERIDIVDVNPHAIARAEAWKKAKQAAHVHVADAMHRPDWAREVARETEGGVDVVLEMSGAEAAVNQALKLVRPGGQVSLLGLPRSDSLTLSQYARDLIFKGVSVQAVIGRRMFDTWERMLELLRTGLDVSFIVSETYPSLEHFHKGMEAFDSGEAQKVVYFPHGFPGDGGLAKE